MNNLHIPITGDNKGFANALNDTRERVKSTARDIEKSGMSIEQMFNRIKLAASASLLGFSIKEFAGKVFQVRSEIQSLQTSFSTLVGNKEKADELFKSIREFAVNTPMQLRDLSSAAQTMMSFNIPVEQIMENLKALGDVSMGDAQRFQSLSLAFSQMSATGKLMGQDLLQMINAGFNPLATMSEKTGKSISELKEEMSKGAISADMVRQAFIDATSEGGKFAGMMEAQSKTLAGAYSNLQGAIDDMFNAIGEHSEGIVAGSINAATELVKNYETVGKVLMGIVAAYGTYKAAVMAVTAIQSLQAAGIGALTAAETIHYGWLVLCEKAQALLNKTMLANQYVLAATALGALASALFMYSSRTDEANKSTEQLNKSFADTQSEIASEQRKIDELFNKLRNAKEGTTEYKNAKDSILRQYGSYLSGLNSEIATLKNVEGAYKAVTKAAREAAMARGMEAAMAKADDSYRTTYSENYDEIEKEIKKNSGEKKAKELMALVRKDLATQGKINKRTAKLIHDATNNTSASEYDVSMTGGHTSTVYKNIDALNQNERSYKEARQKAEEKFSIEEEKKVQKQSVRNKKIIEEEKKNTQAELDALSVVDAMGKKGAALRKKIAGYDKELEAYSTKTDTKASSAAAKAAAKAERDRLKEATDDASSRQRLFDLEQKEQERQAKENADLAAAMADLEIASESDASLREMKQREKDHKERLAQIDKQVEEWKKANYEAAKEKWEAENKDKTKTFSDTEEGKDGWQGQKLTGVQDATRLAMLEKENADEARAAQERTQALIAAHQSYTDKKIQLDREYAETVKQIDSEIAKAKERNDQESVEALERTKRQAATDHAKGQSALSLDILKESPEYIRAFEDLQKTSESTLEYLIEEFEKAKDAAAKSLDPKDLKEYTDTIQRMKDELNSRDPFKAMTESIKKLDTAQKNTKAAKQRLDLVKKGVNVTKSLRKEGDKIVSVYYTQAEAEKELRKAEDEEREAQEEVLDKKKVAQEAIMKLGDSIANLGNTMGGTAGEILNLIGSIMSTTITAIQAVEGMTAAGVTAMKAIESASVILAVIGAALQIFTALFSLLGNGDNYAEAKAQYDALVDVWDELIDKKKEYLSQSWGKEVEGAKQEVLQLLSVMQTEAKIIARERLGAGSSAGSHSYGYRMWQGSYKYNGKNWKDVAPEIVNRLASEGLGNVKFTGMEDLLDMSAEQLAWIKENYTGFWAMMDSDFKDYLEKLMDYSQQEKDILEQAKEQITGTSFDNVFDDLMDSLLDLADGSEDAMNDIAENWQKMINKMFVQNLIGEDLRNQLREWYDAVSQLQDNYTNNRITENSYMIDLEDLKNKYDAIVSDSQQKIAQYTEMGIIKPIGEVSEELKEYFEGIRDSWLDTLTDMEADGKSWKQELLSTIFSDLVESTILNVPITVNGKDFDDFEAYLKDWTSRYKAVIEDTTATDEERNARLKELLDEQTTLREEQAKRSKEIAAGIGYDVVAEISNSLDTLKDTFVDHLLDMDADADKLGKQIGTTLIREMLEQMLASETYADRMDEIKANWQKALNGEEGYTYESVMSQIAELNTDIANDEAIGALAEQWKALNREVENSDNLFGNMRSTFVTDMMDMKKSADDISNDIGKTIAQNIIENMVVASAIQPLIDELQKAYDSAMAKEGATYSSVIGDEGVQSAMAAIKKAFPDLQETAKGIMDGLGVTFETEAVNGFSNLTDTLVNTLKSADSDVETLGKNLAQSMMEQMLKTIVDKKYKQQMDDLNEEWSKALQGGNAEQIDAVRAKVEQLYETIANDDAVKKLADDLKALGDNSKSPFDNMRDSLRSVLTDMSKDAKDFAKDISKTMAEAMIDKYVLGSQYDEWFEAWQKKYDGLIGEDMTEEDRQAALNKLIKEAKEYAQSLDAEAQRWLTAFGQNNAEDQSATMNMAEAATYDQFELYLGIAMAQQMCQEQQKGIQQQILATLQGMGGVTDPSSTTLTEMRNMMMTGNEYLLDIKRSNREILTQFGARLEQINNNLNRL